MAIEILHTRDFHNLKGCNSILVAKKFVDFSKPQNYDPSNIRSTRASIHLIVSSGTLSSFDVVPSFKMLTHLVGLCCVGTYCH